MGRRLDSGGFDLPIGLLHSSTGFRLAGWPSPFVGLHDSVVAHGVPHLRAAFHVPRRAGKRLHIDLTTFWQVTRRWPSPEVA